MTHSPEVNGAKSFLSLGHMSYKADVLHAAHQYADAHFGMHKEKKEGKGGGGGGEGGPQQERRKGDIHSRECYPPG